MSLSKRHVPWSVMEQRVAMATPVRDIVPGTPRITIDVEADGALALCVFVKRGDRESLPSFIRLSCDRRGKDESDHVRLACGEPDHLAGFYSVICRIADRVQLEKLPVDEAIKLSVGELENLLETVTLLSVDKQVGLWGELWLFADIAQRTSWDDAISSWAHCRGANEEHDFVLSDVDIEVKTTRGERRVHSVGATQLRPSPGRSLLLFSLQLTMGGPTDGLSLVELVTGIRDALPDRLRNAFDKGMAHAGWKPLLANNYAATRWRLRSQPLAVESSLLPFLQVHGPSVERILDFRFEINLEGAEHLCHREWRWQ